MNARGGEDVRLDQLVERRQHGGAGADMIGHGRDRELDLLTRIVFALPIEWLVVGVFLDRHHRQHLRELGAAAARARGRRGVNDAPARQMLRKVAARRLAPCSQTLTHAARSPTGTSIAKTYGGPMGYRRHAQRGRWRG